MTLPLQSIGNPSSEREEISGNTFQINPNGFEGTTEEVAANEKSKATEVFHRIYRNCTDLEINQIQQLITTSKDAWIERLQKSEQPFLYLKRKELNSPYTIQVFRDGRIWMHTKQAMYGSAKQIKVVVEWETGKEYVKACTLKHLRTVSWGGDRIGSEYKIYEKLKGKRGIVPLVDMFNYPSKSALNGQKNALIQERWTGDLENLRTWTEKDLKVIAIDLLYAVKAFRDAGLTEGDFNNGNVLVLCDREGKALKAGLIDFEQTEELSKVLAEGPMRIAFDPKTVEFELQNEILCLIKSLYVENNINCPEVMHILYEGYYQKGGDFIFRGRVEEHMPTRTIEEMIVQMEEAATPPQNDL